MLRPTCRTAPCSILAISLRGTLLASTPMLFALGACTQMSGQREAYMHSRQIIVEMDAAPVKEPVTRVASWPGPEFNLTLVRGDALWPNELAQATPTPTLP